jgi:hypothetical protein
MKKQEETNSKKLLSPKACTVSKNYPKTKTTAKLQKKNKLETYFFL